MNQQQSPGDESQKNDAAETGRPAKANSVSRQSTSPQPNEPAQHPPSETPEGLHGDHHDNDCGDGSPTAHVVLYQPEIPQNTGNIGRTCVATGAKLWIVRPAGFRIDDAKLRRAGLDYWQHLNLGDAVNWDDLVRQLGPRRMFFLSRFAKRTIWEARFKRDDVFVFGRETSGLPESILDPQDRRSLRLPSSSHVRSLNLATTVGIVLYEHLRQTGNQPQTGD